MEQQDRPVNFPDSLRKLYVLIRRLAELTVFGLSPPQLYATADYLYNLDQAILYVKTINLINI